MKVERIDHIGILVNRLDKAEELFTDLFESRFKASESETADEDSKSIVNSFGIEFITPNIPNAPMAKTLAHQGEGFLYLSLKVPNLKEAMVDMEKKGIRKTMEVGQFGRGNFKAAFYHPKDTFGVMIELVEYETEHPALSATRVK